jgi:hypothetical protein
MTQFDVMISFSLIFTLLLVLCFISYNTKKIFNYIEKDIFLIINVSFIITVSSPVTAFCMEAPAGIDIPLPNIQVNTFYGLMEFQAGLEAEVHEFLDFSALSNLNDFRVGLEIYHNHMVLSDHLQGVAGVGSGTYDGLSEILNAIKLAIYHNISFHDVNVPEFSKLSHINNQFVVMNNDLRLLENSTLPNWNLLESTGINIPPRS